MEIVRFSGPFGEELVAAEYDIQDVFDFGRVVAGYENHWRVAVRLERFPDDRLEVILGMLDGLTRTDGGEMWEIEDSVLLLTPSDAGDPPGSANGGPGGDRSPLIPARPVDSGAMHLAEPSSEG